MITYKIVHQKIEIRQQKQKTKCIHQQDRFPITDLSKNNNSKNSHYIITNNNNKTKATTAAESRVTTSHETLNNTQYSENAYNPLSPIPLNNKDLDLIGTS